MKQLMYDIGMLVVRASLPPVLTGRLRDSIRAGRGKTKAVVRAGGARIPYAPIIHYGYPARNIQPRPFLLEALQKERGDVFDKLEDGIDDILRKNNLI
jgi:phage gpG-like protein